LKLWTKKESRSPASGALISAFPMVVKGHVEKAACFSRQAEVDEVWPGKE
jgi:hypothetical protein